jgi:C4-dicarboxylate-specific signal transduction histidine kinase
MINAMEASLDGFIVTLTAHTEGSRVAIGVAGHGHRVAAGHKDRRSDPFFTAREHGAGLGLRLAHQIVRQAGGMLIAQPKPEGSVTFSVLDPAKGANQ